MIWNWFSLEKWFLRIFRFVLKRNFGSYLDDFSLKQLNYCLSRGEGSIENVLLNVEVLNKLCEEYNLPFTVLHGSIDYISVMVPWSAPLRENSLLDLKGMKVVVQLKERLEDVSMFDSMWSSMASSLELAQECLNSEKEEDEEIDASNSSDGLQKVARTIEAVVANIKVRFFDSSIKIEHILANGYSGTGLEIKINMADYFDEAGVNVPTSNFNLSGAEKCSYEPLANSNKKVIFEGVSIYTYEFLAQDKAYFKTKPTPSSCVDPSQFIPGSPEMPPTHSSLHVKKTESDVPVIHDEPVLISRLNGKQELKWKLKLNEAVMGPKMDVEFNLGAFNLFLIPQQVHMLFELVLGLMKSGSSNDKCKQLHHCVPNKPMRPADYALVEQELLSQQTRSEMPSKSLKNQRGWSSHSLDESDEEFHLMPMENRIPLEFQTSLTNDNESLCSSVSSDTRSDNFTGGNQKGHKSRSSSVQAMLQDPMTELTHFRVSCSSCCIIILHDDSVNESLNYGSTSSRESPLSINERAQAFFRNLLDLQMSGFDFKDFESAKHQLSKLCNSNHLRFMSSSISIDGNERSSSEQRILNFCVSLFQLEVLECLFDSINAVDKAQEPTYMQILSFENIFPPDDHRNKIKEACCKLKYQQVECTTQNRNIKPPANKLEIQLGFTACEIDISLTDRIRTLLNFHKRFTPIDTKKASWTGADVGSMARLSSKTEINVSSPNVVAKLRFPIPDLRSMHDNGRVPWWQQNLHKEILIMELQDFTFGTVLDDDNFNFKCEVQCRDCHGLFQTSAESKPISFLRVSVDPDADQISRDSGFDWPRLVIRKVTKSVFCDLESVMQDSEEKCFYSLSDAFLTHLVKNPTPSPFAYSSVFYKSHQSNMERDNRNDLSDEEVVKPASKEKMLNFIEQVVSKSEYVFDFSLPTVNIVLPNKYFFEILYNRLSSDLLLWENATLAPTNACDPNGFKVHVPGLAINPNDMKDSVATSIFKTFSNDSNSDSGDEESTYYSVYEYSQRQKEKHKKKVDSNGITKMSISFFITKGMLTINTPVLDDNTEVMPNTCGKLQLKVEEGLIFIASSYKANSDEAYICLLSERSKLYHDGLCLQISPDFPVQPFSNSTHTTLNSIIYESENGMLLEPVCDNKKDDMLKIAVHTQHNQKQQMKTFTVAIDISGATLRHYTYPVSQIWINQFIEFLKVKDYPVNGYIPPAVVTELHLNLSHCAVDYRPLKLPLHTALTVEHFNMSCNVTAATPSFLFRIISEEMRLFISNKIAATKVNLQKNYVCIIDTGLIDISFRSSMDEKNNSKLETYVTNNKLEIRTCADSFRALLDLIIYLSMNGDMEAELNEAEVVKKGSSADLNCVTKVKDSDSENVNLLMAEAMKEYPHRHIAGKRNCNERMNKVNDGFNNPDDEFCILEDDPGIGLMPRNGEPKIRVLTDEPIKIIENHFAIPPGKSDDLKAPEHFPSPIMLVSFREMCLVWHLYGGSDFQEKEKGKSKRKITFNKAETTYSLENGITFTDTEDISNDDHNDEISFCNIIPVSKNSDINAVHFSMENVTIEDAQKLNTFEAWLCRGGPCRNHDVHMELYLNKVQFRHEIYPPDGTYASRYILLIQDAEIRDKLAVSQINKFLYQFSSQTMPRQSHANMVDVKALYTRPDPKRPAEECSLKISCKPLRLNIDQDSLMFLIDFFQEVLGMTMDEKFEETGDEVPSSEIKQGIVLDNQITVTTANQSSTSTDTFYRSFSFSPDVLIRIDYHGKRVLMEQGAICGTLMGLANLTSSEIKLKRISYRHGLLGHHKLLNHALNEWQQDIIKNQKGPVLSGMGGVHSVVQFMKGVKDLFYLPVVQYQKDGQIVRGLQQGASSFTTCTFMAFLDLTSRVVGAIQGVATVAYDMVSPGPSVTYKYQGSQENYHRNCQPADIREGVATAYNVVKEGLSDTARTIYRVASTEHEHKGVPGAVGGVLRQIPPTLVKPFILGSEATHYVLGGVRHQLLPDAHQEDIHKWRTKNN